MCFVVGTANDKHISMGGPDDNLCLHNQLHVCLEIQRRRQAGVGATKKAMATFRCNTVWSGKKLSISPLMFESHSDTF